MANTKTSPTAKTFSLVESGFKEDTLEISYSKWKKWVGKPKMKEFKELKLTAPLFCHEEMEKKHSLCWS